MTEQEKAIIEAARAVVEAVTQRDLSALGVTMPILLKAVREEKKDG